MGNTIGSIVSGVHLAFLSAARVVMQAAVVMVPRVVIINSYGSKCINIRAEIVSGVVILQYGSSYSKQLESIGQWPGVSRDKLVGFLTSGVVNRFVFTPHAHTTQELINQLAVNTQQCNIQWCYNQLVVQQGVVNGIITLLHRRQWCGNQLAEQQLLVQQAAVDHLSVVVLVKGTIVVGTVDSSQCSRQQLMMQQLVMQLVCGKVVAGSVGSSQCSQQQLVLQ